MKMKTNSSDINFMPGDICVRNYINQYGDVIMGMIASQITSLTIIYSTVYSDADQRKHQISASLAFLRGIHQGPVNSPHKWPVTQKMFPFDDVIMVSTVHLFCRWEVLRVLWHKQSVGEKLTRMVGESLFGAHTCCEIKWNSSHLDSETDISIIP